MLTVPQWCEQHWLLLCATFAWAGWDSVTVLNVASTEQRTPSCAFWSWGSCGQFPTAPQKKSGAAQKLSVEKTQISNIGEFFGTFKSEKERSVLFILVSVKEIVSDTSELVSDIGSFSESVPWTAEASNDHQFRVADAVKWSRDKTKNRNVSTKQGCVVSTAWWRGGGNDESECLRLNSSPCSFHKHWKEMSRCWTWACYPKQVFKGFPCHWLHRQ